MGLSWGLVAVDDDESDDESVDDELINPVADWKEKTKPIDTAGESDDEIDDETVATVNATQAVANVNVALLEIF